MKEITNDIMIPIKKWKGILCSWIAKIIIVKMFILPKAILRKKNSAGSLTSDYTTKPQ